MAGRFNKKNSGVGILALFITFVAGVGTYIQENIVVIGLVIFLGIFLFVAYWIINASVASKRKKFLAEVISYINIPDLEKLKYYDDIVVVKSRQTLEGYTDEKYLQKDASLDEVVLTFQKKQKIHSTLVAFLNSNPFSEQKYYKYVRQEISSYVERASVYRVMIKYVTSAGNNLANRVISINQARINDFKAHPELLMSKSEYTKYTKQLAKDELEGKKHSFYERVNELIAMANNSKDNIIIRSQVKALDSLATALFEKTVNSIQKVKDINSDEWHMLDEFISDKERLLKSIIDENDRILEYYESDGFQQIKETCSNLMQSQKEFNEYIGEKADSISRLFGTRIVRNETANEDVYNYIRAYKKIINPFTAEVSASVFGSAENNPINYIVKYFYPNKNQYPEQIDKLRLLIEELETLKDAKDIIENYKKDYAQYIKNVPDYVFEKDENGFYSRLGFATIDESVLNIEYKFIYTSDGGMAQRSFTVPMTEETIIELIYALESKLTMASQVKEQRALMTRTLRNRIKERDKYTCCQCGNSVYNESNLLLEIDHIVPVSKGGLTEESNLQTLCWKCNRNKGAKIV